MDCVLKVEGLLATNIRFVHMRGPINTNRRLAAALQFVTKPNNGAGIPLELHSKIRQLPIAEERTEYVKTYSQLGRLSKDTRTRRDN